MKSAAVLLAGMLSVGAIAGGTIALTRSDQPSNLAATVEPTVTANVATAPPAKAPPAAKTTAAKTTAPITAPMTGSDAAIVPTATNPESLTAAASRPPARPAIAPGSITPAASVTRCRIVMAVVRDNNPPLNVRSQPGTDSAIVGQLNDGNFVSVRRELNGWFEIAEPNGWIAKSKTVSRCGEKVETVQFNPGKTGTNIADEFLGTGYHRYKLSLGQGQTLKIAGSVGPMPAVVAPDGKYLVGMDQAQRQWQTTLPTSGEYTIEMDSNFRGYKYDFAVEVQ
jgi:hypothetical protein